MGELRKKRKFGEAGSGSVAVAAEAPSEASHGAQAAARAPAAGASSLPEAASSQPAPGPAEPHAPADKSDRKLQADQLKTELLAKAKQKAEQAKSEAKGEKPRSKRHEVPGPPGQEGASPSCGAPAGERAPSFRRSLQDAQVHLLQHFLLGPHPLRPDGLPTPTLMWRCSLNTASGAA
eukprot:854445-Pyramimonas_sp.AAC.1